MKACPHRAYNNSNAAICHENGVVEAGVWLCSGSSPVGHVGGLDYLMKVVSTVRLPACDRDTHSHRAKCSTKSQCRSQIFRQMELCSFGHLVAAYSSNDQSAAAYEHARLLSVLDGDVFRSRLPDPANRFAPKSRSRLSRWLQPRDLPRVSCSLAVARTNVEARVDGGTSVCWTWAFSFREWYSYNPWSWKMLDNCFMQSVEPLFMAEET